MALVYSDKYDIDLGGLERLHAFDIHKYQKIAQGLVADKLVGPADFHVPQELSKDQILLVHSPQFLQSLSDPATVARYLEAPPVAAVPAAWVEERILRAFRYASGGTILAARLALEHGIAVNLGGGYHHAKPDAGEGFCVYADMPIAIRLLQKENRIGRALVVDLDAHQGNGTAVCFAGDESVFTFSIHQADIYPIPKEKSDQDIELAAGTGDAEYLKLLRENLPGLLRRSRPDLVFYQAGCDPLAGDPLAGLALSPQGIAARDAYVIDTCAERGLPVVMLLGGGYSPQAWSAQRAAVAGILRKYGRSGGREAQ